MKAYLSMLLIFICISFLSACEDEQQNLVRDVAIEIAFTDKDGNDLLNPVFSGSFNSANTDLFYLRNGQKERVYDINMDYPENFFVYQTGGEYLMRLFPSEYDNNGLTTTYIQFSETDTDTIKCQLSKSDENVIVNKVWYNDKLVWDGQGARYFEVVK